MLQLSIITTKLKCWKIRFNEKITNKIYSGSISIRGVYSANDNSIFINFFYINFSLLKKPKKWKNNKQQMN